MLITALLILILLWHFYLGYSRGLIKQTYYLIATVLSLAVANHYYRPFADRLTLWIPYAQVTDEELLPFFSGVNIFEMDRVFYAGLAFLLLFILAYLGLAFLGIFLHVFPIHRLDDSLFNMVSGFLSVLVTLVFMSLFLNLLTTIPWLRLQTILSGNLLLKALISHFPALSQLIRYLWVTAILG